VCFLWAKGLTAKDIHKEIFPIYGGKCLSRKAVHNWVEKFSQGRSKVVNDGRLGAGVAEKTIKIPQILQNTSMLRFSTHW
jgi:hypothetical protein